jgi:hypothetical protein
MKNFTLTFHLFNDITGNSSHRNFIVFVIRVEFLLAILVSGINIFNHPNLLQSFFHIQTSNLLYLIRFTYPVNGLVCDT